MAGEYVLVKGEAILYIFLLFFVKILGIIKRKRLSLKYYSKVVLFLKIFVFIIIIIINFQYIYLYFFIALCPEA